MKPRTCSALGRRRAGPVWLACAAMAMLPMLSACARFVEVHRTDLLKERPVRRIAVMPFATDLYVERTKGTFEPVVTCLLEGRRYAGGPIPKAAPDEVTATFVQQLVLRGDYELVLPGETQAFVDRQGLDAAALDPAVYFMAIGQGLKVDAVIAGNVLRFDELRGSAFGAERPASVAIDTHLMDALTGALLWEASYREEQATLSENVGSFGTLVQRGAKFLTASQLATWAVEQILEEFPRSGETGKDAPVEAAP